MSTLSFDPETLRSSSRSSVSASDSANSAKSTLSGANVNPSAFGSVSGAGSLSGAISVAHQHHVRGASTVEHNRGVAARRTDLTAQLGDETVVDTAKIASSATPASEAARAVAKGM